jgi:hypothetical protein
MPFGFKIPLVLEPVIIYLDKHISHVEVPIGYSYCFSKLNQMTCITQLSLHFLYSVTLKYKGAIISYLPTRASLLKPQTTITVVIHIILVSQFI